MSEPPRPENGELWRDVYEHQEGNDVVIWWRWSDRERRWTWVPAADAETERDALYEYLAQGG